MDVGEVEKVGTILSYFHHFSHCFHLLYLILDDVDT